MSVRGESKDLKDKIKEVKKTAENALDFLDDLSKKEYSEKWDRKFINDLPNAAFAVVESGYSEGKDKGARHLPHHGKGVKSATENSTVDLPHYRNALNRVNQIKSVLGKDDSALRKKAASHLEKHRVVLKSAKSSFNPIELSIWEECERIFVEKVEPLLLVGNQEEDK